jgi:hypothetical protein
MSSAGSVFMYCAPGLVFTFFAHGLVFGGTGCVESRFLILFARILFRRYRGRRVPFSCYPRSDSFSAVPNESGPVFMFCALVLIFGSTEGVRSRFHFLHTRTHFLWYRGRRVPFSCFSLPESFSAVPRVSSPVFMLCAPELIFGGAVCVGFRFHVLCSRTHFRRYRGHEDPFSCFALLDSFSAVRGRRSRFHILRDRTRFRRYRGRRVPFSCFECPDSFSPVPRVSSLVFMFCAPVLIFGGTESVVSRFQVLCSRTHFRRCRVCRVPFSCFSRPDSFSAVVRASGPVFMFFAPKLVCFGY